MSVRVNLEIGHEASIRTKKTPEGFTHDWEVFVRGTEGADIQYYVDKVVFHLHPSFQKPKRVIKEPPYSVKESGYAGFNFPIDIYLKSGHEPKKIRFNYDLQLQPIGPKISKVQKEKYIFSNPPDEFKHKLLKGGGVVVSSTYQDNNDNSRPTDDRLEMSNKPKLSGSDMASKKQRFEPKNSFQDLFGPPITKSSLESRPIPTKAPAKPEKPQEKPKSKHSPHKDKDREKDKSKDKERGDLFEKSSKSSKEDKKNKDKMKERDRSKEKSSKKDREKHEKDKSPRPRSPSPNRNSPLPPPPAVKHKDRDKDKESNRDSKDSKRERNEEKKSKKEKRDKDHKENRHKDKESSKSKSESKPKESIKEKGASPIPTAPPIVSSHKSDTKKDKPKEKEVSREIPVKVDDEKPEKSRDKTEDKQKHKHKKKDKDKKERRNEEKSHKSEKKSEKASAINKYTENGKESTTTLQSRDSDKNSNLFGSPKSDTPSSTVNEPIPPPAQKKDKTGGASNALSALYTKYVADDSSSANSSREPSPAPPRPPSPPPPIEYKTPVPPTTPEPPKVQQPVRPDTPPEETKVKKKEKSKKKDKKADKDHEKKKKRKAEQPAPEAPPEKVQKEEDSFNNNSDTEQQKESSKDVKEVVDTATKPAIRDLNAEDYMTVLRELQQKIMGLKDNSDLQQVVQLIAETGRYEVSANTFDFDLCLLDRSTVVQLQEFFAKGS